MHYQRNSRAYVLLTELLMLQIYFYEDLFFFSEKWQVALFGALSAHWNSRVGANACQVKLCSVWVCILCELNYNKAIHCCMCCDYPNWGDTGFAVCGQKNSMQICTKILHISWNTSSVPWTFLSIIQTQILSHIMFTVKFLSCQTYWQGKEIHNYQ